MKTEVLLGFVELISGRVSSEGVMSTGYELLLGAIDDFKERKIGFLEIKPWLLGCGIGYELSYSRDWSNDLDAWLECIEFLYPEDDWYELGLSLVEFIEEAIINEPRPLELPMNDRVVRDHLNRRTRA